jgi:hypothetical protein
LVAPLSSTATSRHHEDAAVLTAVIESQACGHDSELPNGKFTVVPDETIPYDDFSFPKDVDASAVQSLKRSNKGPHKLPKIKSCDGVRIVSNIKLKRIFSEGWWKNFYRTSPQASGILHLTLPGFSRDGRTAIVQGASVCGGLCGTGLYWVLKKVNGTWVVTQTHGTWIS